MADANTLTLTLSSGGDVGRVKVPDQFARRLVVAVGDRVEYFADEA